MVGALVSTAVQVGAPPDPALGGPAFAGLQAELDGQVGALAAQSGGTSTRAAATGEARRRGPAADALDDLLAAFDENSGEGH